MSQQYDEYLHEHISNVNKAFWWLIDHGVIPPHLPGETEFLIMHDDSKFQVEEYDAYDDYFYPRGDEDEDDKRVIKSSFDYAWLHHIHNNPHHWQYWVLIGDDEEPKALEMPVSYVYEMIADWWSFSWKTGNLHEIFDWYDKHKDKMILHENTRKLVEDALLKIKDILGESEKEDEPNGQPEKNT